MVTKQNFLQKNVDVDIIYASGLMKLNSIKKLFNIRS